MVRGVGGQSLAVVQRRPPRPHRRGRAACSQQADTPAGPARCGRAAAVRGNGPNSERGQQVTGGDSPPEMRRKPSEFTSTCRPRRPAGDGRRPAFVAPAPGAQHVLFGAGTGAHPVGSSSNAAGDRAGPAAAAEMPRPSSSSTASNPAARHARDHPVANQVVADVLGPAPAAAAGDCR